MSEGPPKSAVELALEKLAKQDAAEGTSARELKAAQRDQISSVRQEYEAGAAECRILHESKLATVVDPEARAELESNLRRDLARLATDRDRKIDRITKGE